MPEKATLKRARRAKRQGKSPTTQAGEFVREEIHHVREGKHGARSTEQAIAIGLSKARRAGVKLKPPPSRRRRTRTAVGRRATSRRALSLHAKKVARQRPASARRASARKAARTRARRRHAA
jgi:hypothetical protein